MIAGRFRLSADAKCPLSRVMATQQPKAPRFIEFRSLASERPTMPAPASPDGVAQYEAAIAASGEWRARLLNIVSVVSLVGSVQS